MTTKAKDQPDQEDTKDQPKPVHAPDDTRETRFDKHVVASFRLPQAWGRLSATQAGFSDAKGCFPVAGGEGTFQVTDHHRNWFAQGHCQEACVTKDLATVCGEGFYEPKGAPHIPMAFEQTIDSLGEFHITITEIAGKGKEKGKGKVLQDLSGNLTGQGEALVHADALTFFVPAPAGSAVGAAV